jgi:hypothetical protein
MTSSGVSASQGDEDVSLGGEVRLDSARSEIGACEVKDLLGRIDYGVHS